MEKTKKLDFLEDWTLQVYYDKITLWAFKQTSFLLQLPGSTYAFLQYFHYIFTMLLVFRL